MTPQTQSQQGTVQKVNITPSVQVGDKIVVTHETKVTKEKHTYLLCIYCLWPF